MTRTDRHYRQTRTDDTITDREPTTMADMSHTHPHADRGALKQVFERGPIVAADGGERNGGERERRERESRQARPDGVSRTSEDERSESSGSERNAVSPSSESDDEEEEEKSRARMKDVNHEPPYGEGVDRVFERGGKEEPVESEE